MDCLLLWDSCFKVPLAYADMSMSGVMEEVITTRFTIGHLAAAERILIVMPIAGRK
jgi:hypothetical protein